MAEYQQDSSDPMVKRTTEPKGPQDRANVVPKHANQSESNNNNNNTDGGAARKAAYGTLSNIAVRLLSFVCTQQAFRMMDDDVASLGKASIQLELLLTTILFVSREGFRLALTRDYDKHTSNNSSSKNNHKNWNVAWLSIPVATVVSSLALLWHIYITQQAQNDKDYRLGGILFCMAAWIEGLAEPAVLYSLRQMNVATRVSAEGLATLCKTLVTVVALKRWMPDWPVFAFGVAQFSYAVVYFLVLYSKTWSVLPLPTKEGYDGKTIYMTFLFTVQGLFKHLLTEGDRIVLSTLSGSYDQGVYAMGSAYGGLAARFLLQPLEENSRLLFSRLHSSSSSTRSGSGGLHPIKQTYAVLVKLVLYIGFTFSFLATNYTSILLNLLAGRKWGSNQEAIAVLSAFCVYTAFLAWNGMSEAFIYGVTTSGGEIGQIGLVHTLVGGFFAILAPVMVSKEGAVGLVAANCIAMLLRSFYSVYFAATYFAKTTEIKEKQQSVISVLWRLLRQVFPHPLVMAAFGGSFFITRASLGWFLGQNVAAASLEWFMLAARHIAVGALCFVVTCAVAFTVETNFRRSIRQLLHDKED